MVCNDTRCKGIEMVNGVCMNRGCSHSGDKNRYPFHELISKVIVTPDCSSGMLKQINSWSLKPSTFKITEWETVTA